MNPLNFSPSPKVQCGPEVGHGINYMPPAATNGHDLVWGHLVGLDGIEKDISQDLDGEPIVDGATGGVVIILKSGTPVRDGQRLARCQQDTGRKYG